jgi:hypothetical protein
MEINSEVAGIVAGIWFFAALFGGVWKDYERDVEIEYFQDGTRPREELIRILIDVFKFFALTPI